MENKKQIPPHLNKWNWGAFLLTTLWSIRFRVWIGLLGLIPFVGFILSFILGFHGSRWAWEKGSFNSEEEFQKSQKRWMVAGLLIWSTIILSLGTVLLLNDPTKEALAILNQDSRVTSILGQNIVKTSRFPNYSVELKNNITSYQTSFSAKGSLKSAEITLKYKKLSDKLLNYKILIIDSTGETIKFKSEDKPISDNPEDMLKRGISYYDKENYEESFKWVKLAADQGLPEAQFNLGVMYEKGLGAKQNYKQAIIWYKKAAEQGDADALFNLSLMHEKGLGVKPDYKEAISWLKKAAEQGLPQAQFNLGVTYEKGLGTKQDYKQAITWYKKAAEQGDADAQINLGGMHEKGLGTKQDYKQAITWYKKAANQGLPEAQVNLGAMYAEGLGLKQDYNEAITWWKKAAEQGHPGAQANLNRLYRERPELKQETNKN